MTRTPNLQLPEFGSVGVPSGADLTLGMRMLDVIVQLHVIAFATSPATIPVLGDRYIVQSPAIGAFIGHERHVVTWTAEGWQFLVPEHGWMATVGDALVPYVFDLTIQAWRANDASAVGYDNSGSGLSATNVQDALDEIAGSSGSGGTHVIRGAVLNVGTNYDWSPTGLSVAGAYTVIIVNDWSSGYRDIYGLDATNRIDGDAVEIYSDNTTGWPMRVYPDDAGNSNASSRVLTPNLALWTTGGAQGGVRLIFDATANRWRLLGKT